MSTSYLKQLQNDEFRRPMKNPREHPGRPSLFKTASSQSSQNLLMRGMTARDASGPMSILRN